MPEREGERKLDEPSVRSRFPMTSFIITKDVFEKCTMIFFCLTQECCHGYVYSLGPSKWICVCLCASLGKWSYCFLCSVNFVEFLQSTLKCVYGLAPNYSIELISIMEKGHANIR